MWRISFFLYSNNSIVLTLVVAYALLCNYTFTCLFFLLDHEPLRAGWGCYSSSGHLQPQWSYYNVRCSMNVYGMKELKQTRSHVEVQESARNRRRGLSLGIVWGVWVVDGAHTVLCQLRVLTIATQWSHVVRGTFLSTILWKVHVCGESQGVGSDLEILMWRFMTHS